MENINELKLREIIREEIMKVFPKIILSEMAFDLNKYKDQVRYHIRQIAINWCLVRYTDYNQDYIKTRNHWSGELVEQMSFIAAMKLKKGNNPSAKEKALFSIWNEFDFDTDETAIDMTIASKFESEGIDTSSDEYINVTQDFKNETRNIVSVILSNNRSIIKEYVKNI